MICGHGLSMTMIMVSSCTHSVIFWFPDTRMCTIEHNVVICVQIFLHSRPLLAFSTGRSYEHPQSQCVFEKCNVPPQKKKKKRNDDIDLVNFLHLLSKPFVFLFSQVTHTHTITVICPSLQQQKPHWGYNRVTSAHVWPWTGISYDNNIKFPFLC